MKEKFDYVLKLQVVDCTLSNYAKPGQQFIHQDLYFTGLHDAFADLLRHDFRAFDKRVAEAKLT